MPKQDKINRDEIEEDYGLSYALFKAFPELERLLKRAVSQSWTPGKFQVELRQTDWFKNHSDIWREMTALKYSDPATYKERVATARAQVGDLAGSFGIDLSKKGLNRLAVRSVLLGMEDAELRNILAKHVKPSDRGNYGGQLATIQRDLEQTMALNGIDIPRKRMNKWMKRIVRGEASADQFKNAIRNMAARQFPLYEEQFDAGMDLADIATPYMQTMSQILELSPTQLDVSDRKIRRALSGVPNEKGDGRKGKQGVRPMSISEWEDILREDKRWAYTQSAKEQATEYAVRLGEAFGVI